jgi:hypothetical protein
MHPQVARNLSETVQFLYDTPVEVCLKYNGMGKPCQTPSGAPRYLFTLNDGPPGGGRVMFLDEREALRVADNFAAGQCFWICKRRGRGKGAKPVWDMWVGDRRGPMEENLGTDATQLQRDLARSIDRANAGRRRTDAWENSADELDGASPSGHGELRVPVDSPLRHNGTSGAGQPPVPSPAPTACRTPAAPPTRGRTQLEDALFTAVAACHAAQEFAREIGFTAMPAFTGEDLRCMANTLLINGAQHKRGSA